MLDPTVNERISAWLNGNYDEESKAAVRRMSEDELFDAFYKDLEFGTGGLRGLMGQGPNRMNRYTVGAATQALSNYLKEVFADEKISVAIAYDSRHNSRFFAQVTADVFSANGIKVFLFEELRPTPELSFAVRHLSCKAGVVLTASHNPKEYNGYKAYWDDGAQVVSPHDKNIMAEARKITEPSQIFFERNEKLIKPIGKEIDEAYIDQVLSLSVFPEVVKKHNDIRIVYSSLHGTGGTLIPEVLNRMGFEKVRTVTEQASPDGNFPTVLYPNPEERDAMEMALEQAVDYEADLVMATDPDADRVGIAVRNSRGEFILLNGNQTAALLIGYVMEARKKAGKIDGKQMVVKTIVTTELIDDMAAHYGVDCFNTLTGFKHIAALIRTLEGKKEFIAGGEESYGYMIGDAVRDKDAVASCAMIAEMVAYAASKNMTLFDKLPELCKKHGFYLERLVSVKKEGQKGAKEIKNMMSEFRKNPPSKLAGSKVVRILDYQSSIEHHLKTGEKRNIDLPKSNVLQFYTENGSKVSMRPSGTEPKIKFYFSVKGKLKETLDYFQKEKELNERIDALIKDLKI